MKVTQKIENAMQLVIAFSRFLSERSLRQTATHLVETLVEQRDDDDFLCRSRGRWGPTFRVDDLPCSSECPRCTLRDDFCIQHVACFNSGCRKSVIFRSRMSHICILVVQKRIHCHCHEAEATCTLTFTASQSFAYLEAVSMWPEGDWVLLLERRPLRSAFGAELTVPTQEQADYVGVKVEGSFAQRKLPTYSR